MSSPAHFDSILNMWVVHDPDDVSQVLLDPETFRPDNALTAFTPISTSALKTLSTVGFALPPTLANNASDTHRGIRQCVARYFSPARVAAVEPLTRKLNVERFDEVAGRLEGGDTVDLVPDVVGQVPAIVLVELLGLEGVDLARLKSCSIDSLELFWGRPNLTRQEELASSAAEFYGWLRTVVQSARDGRGGPFFGDLVGLGLTDEEICAIGYFLLIAGQETTAQLISTIVFRTLADRQLWRAVARDPEAAREAVDDALREDSSVPTWRRCTVVASRVGDVAVPAGATILLQLSGTGGSAELAFGMGLHKCLGARLARMEAQVALQTAATILPAIELVDLRPPMIDLLSFRAPSQVLVRGCDQVDRRREPRPAPAQR